MKAENWTWLIIVGIALFSFRSCRTEKQESTPGPFRIEKPKAKTDPDVEFCYKVLAEAAILDQSQSNELSDRISIIRQFADAITRIDKSEIDPRLKDWAARYVDQIYEVIGVLQEFQYRISDSHVQQAMIESLLRGYNGDPLGKMQEEARANTQLERRFRQSQNELHRLFAEFQGLCTKFGVDQRIWD